MGYRQQCISGNVQTNRRPSQSDDQGVVVPAVIVRENRSASSCKSLLSSKCLVNFLVATHILLISENSVVEYANADFSHYVVHWRLHCRRRS